MQRQGSNNDVPRGTLLKDRALVRVPFEADTILHSVEPIVEGKRFKIQSLWQLSYIFTVSDNMTTALREWILLACL